jgi:hypothetical protein
MDRKRRIWGMVFLVSGLVALLAAGLMAFEAASAPAVAAVAWPLTIFAGYRMWRAAHPAASVWRELGRRGLAVATFGATAVALLFIKAVPQVLVVVVGVWFVLLATLVIALVLSARSAR